MGDILSPLSVLSKEAKSKMAAAAILKNQNQKLPYLAGILLLSAQFSHGLVNSAMGQIPC